MFDQGMAALLEGMPSPDEMFQMQAAPKQPALPTGLLEGMPSPDEMFGMKGAAETPGQVMQRMERGARQPLVQEMAGLPAASFNPIWNSIQTAGNRMIGGGIRMASNLVGLATPMGGEAIASGGERLADVFDQRIKAKDEAYQVKFGHPAPWYEKLTEGIGTSVIEMATIAGKTGRAPYFMYMGDQAWNHAIKEADENDITGWKKYAYASVDTALEVATEFIFSEKGKGALAEVTGMKKFAKPILKRLAKSAAEEGGEEGINQIGQNLNHMLHGVPVNVADPNSPTGQRQLNPTGSVSDFFAYTFNGVPMAVAQGAGAGGVISGSQQIQEHVQEQRRQITPQNPSGAPQQPAQESPQAQPGFDAATNPPPEAQNAPPVAQPQPLAPVAVAPPQAPPEAQVQESVPEAAQEGVEQPDDQPVGWKNIPQEVKDKLRELGSNNAQIRKMTAREIEEKLGTIAPFEQPATPTERPPNLMPVVETPHIDQVTQREAEQAPLAKPQPAPAVGPQMGNALAESTAAFNEHYLNPDGSLKNPEPPAKPVRSLAEAPNAYVGGMTPEQANKPTPTVEEIRAKKKLTPQQPSRQPVDIPISDYQNVADYEKLVADEKPVQVASKTSAGRILLGQIHSDILKQLQPGETIADEGFVTNKNRYVGRVEAAMLTGGDYWKSVADGTQDGSSEGVFGLPDEPAPKQSAEFHAWATGKAQPQQPKVTPQNPRKPVEAPNPIDREPVTPQKPTKAPEAPAEKPFVLETKPKAESKKQDFGTNATKGKPLFAGANDLPGQKYLPGAEPIGELREPDKEKRSAAAKKGAVKREEKIQSNAEEVVLLRAARDHDVYPEDLAQAVDDQIAIDREHYNALKEAIEPYKNLAPGQRKKIQEGDEEHLGKGFDEYKNSFDAESGNERSQSGIKFDDAFDAIANGLPPEPSATDEAYVQRVAKELGERLEATGDTSFEPDVSFYKANKKQTVPTLQPKPGDSAPVGENAVRSALGKLFDVPIFRGRVDKHAGGVYRWLDKTIRLSSAMWANVAVATHEIGHAIDDKYKVATNATPGAVAELFALDYNPKKRDAREGFAEFVRHYLTMDDAATFPAMSAYFDQILSDNPELAKQFDKAKSMIDQLRTREPMDVVLGQQNPNAVEQIDTRSAWDKVKETASDWTTRYLDAWHNSQIRVLKLAAEADTKAGRAVEGFYNLWNRLSGSYFRRAVAALEHGIHTISGEPKKLYENSAKEIYEPIKPEEVSEFSGYVYSQVFLANMERKPGYNPGRTKEELDAAVESVKKDSDKFQRFDKAARELTQYFHALVDLEVHEGAKSHEEGTRIKDSMPTYYAPVYRTIDYGVDKAKSRGGFGARPGFLNAKATPRRLGQGSGDQYMSLEDALVKSNADSHRVAVQYAMIAPFLRRLLPSLGGVHGMGDQITEVDPKSVMDKARLGGLLDDLVKKEIVSEEDAQRMKDVDVLRNAVPGKAALARLEAEYGTDDVQALLKLTGDVRGLREAIAFWRLDFGSSDKEHIIHIHINGQEKLVQFKSHDLWKAMRGMRNVGESNTYAMMYAAVADGFKNKITKPLQSVSVGMNPTAVAALSLMDYPAFLIQSKHTGAVEGFVAPLYNVVRLAAAMAYEDFGGKMPKWARTIASELTPDLIKREISTGRILRQTQAGESATVASNKLFGESTVTTANVKRRFVPQSQEEAWYHTIPSKMEAYREWMAAPDSGMRLAEMVGYARSKGYKVNKNASPADIDAGKNGWIDPDGKVVDAPPSQILSGIITAGNEVITNYKPKGYMAAEVGKFVPFFTARMAGIAKEVGTIKEFGGGLLNKVRGKESGVENAGPRLARMAALATMAAMYWWFHHDDDDRKDMDPSIADRFWTFSSGGIPYAKITKPRGYGIFINAIEGLLDLAVDKKNPHILEKLGVEAQELSPVSSLNPANWPAGISTIYQVATNQDWAGKPIEHEWDAKSGLKIPYRVQPHTLESSKFLSRFFTQYLGLSPAKTEYLLNQLTGTFYSDIVGTSEQVYNRMAHDTPINMRNLPIIRREAARGLYQRSIKEFNDLYKASESNVTTAKHEGWDNDQTKLDAEKFRQLDRYKDAMSAIRKAAATVKDYDEKLKLDALNVGVADYALGKEPRESFPNPLAKGTKLPDNVAEARDKFILSLAHSITNNPSLKGIKTPKQLEAFPERVEKAKVEREWASAELKRLGYQPADVAKMLMQKSMSRGQRVSPQTIGELASGMR